MLSLIWIEHDNPRSIVGIYVTHWNSLIGIFDWDFLYIYIYRFSVRFSFTLLKRKGEKKTRQDYSGREEEEGETLLMSLSEIDVVIQLYQSRGPSGRSLTSLTSLNKRQEAQRIGKMSLDHTFHSWGKLHKKIEDTFSLSLYQIISHILTSYLKCWPSE